jgi:hypothetical protein
LPKNRAKATKTSNLTSNFSSDISQRATAWGQYESSKAGRISAYKILQEEEYEISKRYFFIDWCFFYYYIGRM